MTPKKKKVKERKKEITTIKPSKSHIFHNF